MGGDKENRCELVRAQAKPSHGPCLFSLRGERGKASWFARSKAKRSKATQNKRVRDGSRMAETSGSVHDSPFRRRNTPNNILCKNEPINVLMQKAMSGWRNRKVLHHLLLQFAMQDLYRDEND